MKTKQIKTKVIPLSETKELESNDLLYLRRHAKLVFNNLERKIKLQNNNEHEPRQQKSWFDGGNNNNTKEEVGGKEEVKEEENNDHDDQHLSLIHI